MPEPPRRAFLRQSLPAAGMLAPGAHAATIPSPVATTRHGPIRGYLDNGIKVFRGIRYGADTAPRRFMAPLPPQPWSEIRDALEHGPTCPQSGREDAVSEDCLFLNLYPPPCATA